MRFYPRLGAAFLSLLMGCSAGLLEPVEPGSAGPAGMAGVAGEPGGTASAGGEPVAGRPPEAAEAPEDAAAPEAPELAPELDEEEPPPSSYGDSLAIINDSRRRGELPAARIQAGIDGGQGALGACIAKAARIGPVEGRVVVSFLIEPDGGVQNAAFLVSTLTDDVLAGCVLEAVRAFEFQRPRGGVVLVSYPFQFRAS